MIEYATLAVTPLSTTQSDRLERFQRRAARLCLRIPLFRPVHHSSMLHRLSLPTLYSRRVARHTIFAHKIHTNNIPPHIRNLGLVPIQNQSYSLRHSRLYHIPTARTDRHRDSPLNTAIHYFNLLPHDIRIITNQKAFKEAAEKLLINSICSCSLHPVSPF